MKYPLSNISIIICVFSIFSCRHQSTSPGSIPYSPHANYSQLSEILDTAYEQNSQVLLDAFFEGRGEVSPAYTPQMVSAFSETIVEAYKVFIEYHSPTNLSRLTGGKHEDFETDFRYIIVQNSVRVAVADTNPRYFYHEGVHITETYIEDFRSAVDIPEFPSVYLSSQVDSLIFYFLFNPDLTDKEDRQARVDFLRQSMQLPPTIG